MYIVTVVSKNVIEFIENNKNLTGYKCPENMSIKVQILIYTIFIVFIRFTY